jgi:hypothetical protein
MREFPIDVPPWADHEYLLATLPTITTKEFIEIKEYNSNCEHQVGRYLNWQAIVAEIYDQDLSGDVIEFGTWQGLSLLMLAQLFDNATSPRKFIGIDSFAGLPITSNHWQKGQFDNTSSDDVLTNFDLHFAKNTLLSYDLIKGWFDEPHVADMLYNVCKNPLIIHFDADLKVSTDTALKLVEPYLIDRKQPIYFLFDDWGNHPDEIPIAWSEWLSTAEDLYHLSAEEISSTVHTRNFRITFN